MANRCTLHKTKLEDFKSFLDSLGIAHRPGKGDYQVLQVQTEKHGYQVVFEKSNMPEHYSVNDKLMPIVRRFLDHQSKNNHAENRGNSRPPKTNYKDLDHGSTVVVIKNKPEYDFINSWAEANGKLSLMLEDIKYPVFVGTGDKNGLSWTNHDDRSLYYMSFDEFLYKIGYRVKKGDTR